MASAFSARIPMSMRLIEFRVLSGDGAARKAQPAAGGKALKPGDEVQVVSDASGFFVLMKCLDCETLWMLATGTAIGPYLSILQYG